MATITQDAAARKANDVKKNPVTLSVLPVGEDSPSHSPSPSPLYSQKSLCTNSLDSRSLRSGSSPSPSPSPGPGPKTSYVNRHLTHEEKAILYSSPTSARARIISEIKHPTWRLWTVLIVAIMFLSAVVIGSTLLALAHHHAVTAGPISSTSRTTDASGPIVDLGYSQYQGVSQGSTNAWLGIRYAQPPLKDLRFKAPQDPKSTKGVQKADRHGAYCLPSPSTGLTHGADEDCLFLDVMAPSDTSKKHPVFIFIQGGGLNGNASPNLNGSHIIENGDNDIIVVTFNYRVGFLGFLASKEVKSGGNLNVGLLDQRKVLQWVQTNIDKFGGDPKRVTLGGASAGAASVNLHLMAYGGRDDGLFQAAAGESNSFGQQLTIDESQYQYDALVKRVNCDKDKDTLKCLRDLDIKTLAAKNSLQPTPNGGVGNPIFMYSNIIDGDFTQDYTYKAFAEGKFIQVPTIFGGDSNEGTIFTPSSINNKDDLHKFLKDNWVKLNSSHFDNIDKYYPEAEHYPNKGNFWRTAANAYGEIRYNCPGIFLNQRFVAAKQPSYHYHWDVLSPENKASGMGVTHTAEQGSIWGTSGGIDAAQQPIIGKYWASFIRTHDPNTHKDSKAPVWMTYDGNGANKHVKMHFDTNATQNSMTEIGQGQIDKCAYFASIGPSILT